MQSVKRSSSLADKFNHPVYGLQIMWYVNYVMTREDMASKDLAHTEKEREEIYDKFHHSAMMEYAVQQGWIQGYYIVPTKRGYPHSIKAVRLIMPKGIDRRCWKLMLGNRVYKEVHNLAKRIAVPESDRITVRPTPPPHGNVYHGRNFRPGGNRHLDPRIKESALCR